MSQHKSIDRDGHEETEEEKRRKKKALQPIYDELKAADEGVIPAADLLVEPSVDKHAALLLDAQLSHRASAAQIAQIVTGLQQHYGNTHVQEVMAVLRASEIDSATVKAAMLKAWKDSQAGDQAKRHEEGGYIVKEGAGYGVERWPAGGGAELSIPARADDGTYNGKEVVGDFHTHPNPSVDESGDQWEQGPSPADIDDAKIQKYSGGSYVVSAEKVYVIAAKTFAVSEVGKTETVLGK